MSKFARLMNTSLRQKQFLKCVQHNPMKNPLRKLMTPFKASNPPPETKLFTEVLEAVQKNIKIGGQNREFLSSILPPSQSSLPPRTMEDSLTHAFIPIGSNPDVRLKYTSHIGGARLGRLVQDMDHFAAVVVYNYILNPLQDPEGLSAHAVVTAMMDHLYIRENIRNDADIKLIGHVTWVGSSSAEVGVRMEQMEEGEWKRVCEARFVMVARDAATGRKSAPLNPLVVESSEEKKLFKLGEKNIEVRAKADQDSLFKEPPSKFENKLIHNMFLSTVDHKARSFSARVKPDNSAWMTESKLKSTMLCEPEHKNDYNKIVGGLIMEKCLDLAFTNAWVYMGAAEVPVCTHIDDVVFLKAVEIGDLLYFHSQVVFTHENTVQTRVSAEVLDRETKRLKLTSVLQVSFKLPSTVPHVVPQSYHEAMAYLTGRRHFLISLKNEGLLTKGEVEEETLEAIGLSPSFFAKGLIKSKTFGDQKSSDEESAKMFREREDQELFMDPEMTKCIRAREAVYI